LGGIKALVAHDSDRDLVTRARGDDDDARAARRALYERHAERVHALLLGLVRDPDAAADLLQETFLRAFRHAGQQDGRRSFRGWALRIARNAALDHLHAAAKARRALGDEGLARRQSDDPAGAAARAEATEDARAALDALPDADRALLLQRHGLGLKLTELAEALACTERTVRNRLDRAAARLTREVVARHRAKLRAGEERS